MVLASDPYSYEIEILRSDGGEKVSLPTPTPGDISEPPRVSRAGTHGAW